MRDTSYKGEIRDSVIRDLLHKTKRSDYGEYLLAIRLENIRFFDGAQLRFDFPVTALIGPNGSGKSTILGSAACIYQSIAPKTIFVKSVFGDDRMDGWLLEYELIDRAKNPTGVVKAAARFERNGWIRSNAFMRPVKLFGINRTVGAAENALFSMKKRLRGPSHVKTTKKFKKKALSISPIEDVSGTITEAEKILGKALDHFKRFRLTLVKADELERIEDAESYVLEPNSTITAGCRLSIPTQRHAPPTQDIYIGGDGFSRYSEFNFGSGEASVIRMVADIEDLPVNSLVLIEEIENGLHPLAVNRMVEYLISVAKRKRIQTIFTTHSDYALAPLPSEAIWSSVDGRLRQGKLSIEALRAVSGRVDRRLAIFVEDEFAKHWVEAILREELVEQIDEIGVYAVAGDGNAVATHLGHLSNPSIMFHSLCFIDGNSEQLEDPNRWIFKLPGQLPESTVFDSVISNLDNNIAMLTVACQRSSDKQDAVAEVITSVSRTNRDPHLLFNQVGNKLGFLPEAIVRGAFFSIWIQEHPDECNRIAKAVSDALQLPPKTE